MRNIVNDNRYLKDREEIQKFFQDKYKTNMEVYNSPDGVYQLTIEQFEVEGGWAYSRGIITSSDDNIRIELRRNIRSFLFKWVEKDQKKYLLCGQDYQGYSIVDLSNGNIIDFVPEAYYEGMGFCWADIHYTKNMNILVVEGCYWADEYEIVFYDFSAPEHLPYKEILRVSPYENVIGWTDHGCFEYKDINGEIKCLKVFQG